MISIKRLNVFSNYLINIDKYVNKINKSNEIISNLK